MYLPTTDRTGGAATTAASSSSSSSSESKVPGFAKELISLIKENGLNSDVSIFLNNLERTLTMAGDPTGENMTMKDILRAQKMANAVKQNYASYQTAEKSLEAQDAWSEPATTARGWLYIMDPDTKKISTVSPKDFNPEKHISLTNQDLMNYRRENPDMAFQSDILDNLASAVGMKSITDYARGIIQDFGKTTITGYSQKQASNIQMGMDQIVSGANIKGLIIQGPDGVYKISQEAPIADTHLKEALTYIKQALPNSYLNTLNAKAAAEGYSPDAMLYLMIQTSADRKMTADYEHTASEDLALGGAGKKAEKEQMVQSTLPDEVARGTNLQATTFYVSANPERVSDKSMMAVAAWNAFPLVDEHKKPLYRNNLESLLPQVFNIRGADYSQITFGNQEIDNSTQLKGLVWDGKSEVKRVALPKTVSEHGTIVPDLDFLTKYNEVLAEVSDKPGMSKLEIQQKLKEKLYDKADDIIIDENNNIIIRPEKMGIFLSFAAYANRDIVEVEDKSKKFLRKLTREEGRLLRDDYNRLVQYGKLDANKKTPKIHDVTTARSNDFYYGNVYMPIIDSTQGFRLSNDQYYPKNTFTDIGAKAYINSVVQQNKSNDSWITNYGQ